MRQWISSLLDALREHLPGIKEAEARAGGAVAEAEPEPEDPRFVAAEEALASGDYAAAELAYQQILAVEPANAEAKAALAQTGLLARVEKLPAGCDRAGRRRARTTSRPQRTPPTLQLADGDVEGAFARLVGTAVRAPPATTGPPRASTWSSCSRCSRRTTQQVIKARRALAAALY